MINGQHAMNATSVMMIEDANKTLNNGESYLLIEGVKDNGTPFSAWVTCPQLQDCLNGSITLKAMQANNTKPLPKQK